MKPVHLLLLYKIATTYEKNKRGKEKKRKLCVPVRTTYYWYPFAIYSWGMLCMCASYYKREEKILITIHPRAVPARMIVEYMYKILIFGRLSRYRKEENL